MPMHNYQEALSERMIPPELAELPQMMVFLLRCLPNPSTSTACSLYSAAQFHRRQALCLHQEFELSLCQASSLDTCCSTEPARSGEFAAPGLGGFRAAQDVKERILEHMAVSFLKGEVSLRQSWALPAEMIGEPAGHGDGEDQ